MEFGEKTQKRLLRRSRLFKVIEVGISRKPVCDFLLVINSNWYPISCRFGLIAAYCSIFGHFALLSHPLLTCVWHRSTITRYTTGLCSETSRSSKFIQSSLSSPTAQTWSHTRTPQWRLPWVWVGLCSRSLISVALECRAFATCSQTSRRGSATVRSTRTLTETSSLTAD